MKPGTQRLRARLLALMAALLMAGCSTAPIQEGPDIDEPIYPASRVLNPEVDYTEQDIISDPWQGFNRTMYRFNYRFDKYVFLPAVKAYWAVTPDFLEAGIHNFFRNIQDITTLINSILQLSPEKTANTTTRLVINTGIGLLGFINVAHDVPRSDEDFGQTLGHWGVGTGPYLVLPVMGPSNVRDGIGKGVDWITLTSIRNWALDLDTWQVWTWGILGAIDQRAHVPFLYYGTGSPFEYELVRMLYTTKRQLDVER